MFNMPHQVIVDLYQKHWLNIWNEIYKSYAQICFIASAKISNNKNRGEIPKYLKLLYTTHLTAETQSVETNSSNCLSQYSIWN